MLTFESNLKALLRIKQEIYQLSAVYSDVSTLLSPYSDFYFLFSIFKKKVEKYTGTFSKAVQLGWLWN